MIIIILVLCSVSTLFFQEARSESILPPINECSGINEDYNNCSSACPMTCVNMYQDILCYAVCLQTCDCIKGYVRNNKNECVSPIDCPSEEVVCPPDQVFNNCYGCVVRTCSELSSAKADASRPVCATVCNTGCLCKEPGYVIDDITRKGCILPETCPSMPETCKANEIWRSCSSSCPKSCGNMYTTEICDTKCNAKCDCIDGYVRNLAGYCILPTECPENEIRCPLNQELNPCHSSCGPRTCSGKPIAGVEYIEAIEPVDPGDIISKIRKRCLWLCVNGCGCPDGYVWDDVHNTGCILLHHCPPSLGCSPTELEDHCVEPCQPTCANPNPLQCLYVWFGICGRGCVCKPPLVRDDITGKCVDRSYCESQCPGKNEVQYPCSGCKRVTCANYKQSPSCDILCAEGTYICDCENDYIFDEVRNQCVPEYLCNIVRK